MIKIKLHASVTAVLRASLFGVPGCLVTVRCFSPCTVCSPQNGSSYKPEYLGADADGATVDANIMRFGREKWHFRRVHPLQRATFLKGGGRVPSILAVLRTWAVQPELSAAMLLICCTESMLLQKARR